MKTIVLGADHGGFELKNTIKAHLEARGFGVIDVGTNSADSCDYPIFASLACQKVLDGNAELGILVCGTGIGMSMAANKHKGIRCALCSEPLSAKMTRLHNNANVLALGAGLIGPNMANEIVDTFLNTEFSGDERHQRRIDLIEQ